MRQTTRVMMSEKVDSRGKRGEKNSRLTPKLKEKKR